MPDYLNFTSTIHRLIPSLCSSLYWVCFFVHSKFSLFTSLIIVLHLYYKLDYIKLSWGRAKEQAIEHLKGNPFAKNWQDKALKVVEKMVSVNSQSDLQSHMNK